MKYLLYTLPLVILVLIGSLSASWRIAHGYAPEEPQTQNITNNTNQLINSVLKSFAPGGAKDIVNQSQSLLNTPNVPKPSSNSLFNLDSFSTNDLITPIKAIITLIVNLFFVVIQVVVQILQALLGALPGTPK